MELLLGTKNEEPAQVKDDTSPKQETLLGGSGIEWEADKLNN